VPPTPRDGAGHAPASSARVALPRRGAARLAGGLACVVLGGLVVTLPPAAGSTGADPDGDAGSGRGSWEILALDGGGYEVSWTSPSMLPLGSDRPRIVGAGVPSGVTTIDPDGRTVRSVVTAAEAPNPADLDVLLSGDRVDERGLDPAVRRRAAPADRVATTVLPAADPGLPGALATVTSDYELEPVKLAGLPRRIEMVGHVVEPGAGAVTGPRPLVLFLHGRHDVCYDVGDLDHTTTDWPCQAPFAEVPNHLGYDYLQQVLASQGFATVSVRVNGINAQDFRLADGGAGARAQIVERHLDHWVDLADDHQVDLDEVVLVGHSRGGEGVARASIRIPASAPYRVAGQVLLAPTDFASQASPYVPTVTVLPYCDGDVYDSQGQQFTDVARDLADDDTSLKSSVLVMGANHNYFNTEWTPGSATAHATDDWRGDPRSECGAATPDRLTRAEQRAVGTAYVAGAVALFTGDASPLPLFDGSSVRLDSLGDADVRSHAIGGGRDLRRPGADATLTDTSGGATAAVCRGRTSPDAGSATWCGRKLGDLIAPHWTPGDQGRPTTDFLTMSWTEAGAVAGLRLVEALDLSTGRLELRTIVDPRTGPVRLDVRLTDSAGGQSVLSPDNVTDGGDTLAPLPVGAGLTKLWAQSLLVDAAALDPTDPDNAADLSDIISVELIGRSDRGRLWVADLAAASSALVAVPDRRLPQVSLGEASAASGELRSTREARVPFVVEGSLDRPARFVVQRSGVPGSRALTVVDLAPGQTSGSIPLAFGTRRLDGMGRQVDVAAWGVDGVVTADYLGRLRVLGDDPDLVLRVRPVRRVVREGEPVEVRARLVGAGARVTHVYAEVVPGRGSRLRGDDLRPGWLTRRGYGRESRRPLHRLGVGVGGRIPAGQRDVTLHLPTVRDSRREAPERVTLLVRFNHQRLRATVTVADRR